MNFIVLQHGGSDEQYKRSDWPLLARCMGCGGLEFVSKAWAHVCVEVEPLQSSSALGAPACSVPRAA